MSEPDVPSAGAVQPPKGPEHLRLVRITDRFIHNSAQVRTRELEFHVRNDTDKEFSFLYLPLPSFVLNLRVHDEDDRRLNVALSSEVNEALGELERESPTAHEHFQLRFKDVKYRLGVFFPPDALLRRHTTRIITLRFEDDDPVLLTPVLKRNHAQFALFTVPLFEAEKVRFPGHVHEYFFVVVGPSGYAIDWETSTKGTLPTEKMYENGKKGAGRVLSVRLPPAAKAHYTWSIKYELRPARPATVTVLNTFYTVAMLAAAISIGVFLFEPDWLTAAVGSAFGTALNGALVATALAMLYALNDEWAERYKVALLWPILFNAIAWALWVSQ